MNQFASVDIPVGLHWALLTTLFFHPFLIYPISTLMQPGPRVGISSFEDQDATTRWLQGSLTNPSSIFTGSQ